jgi:anhydro-N-acetylmuramic acid kinase
MAGILRFEQSRAGDGRRWFAGVLVSSQCAEVSAALLAISGQGLDARVHVAGCKTLAVPRETSALFNPSLCATAYSAGILAALRVQLAEVQAALVGNLLAEGGIAPGRILALGVHDPGLWRLDRGSATGSSIYLGLCDAAKLTEATGLCVLDAFPARDVAQQGLGGPVTALAEWVLLRDPGRGRVMVDLGRTARMSYLPAESVANASARIVSFDVGPGMRLLDLLAHKLTNGQHAFDPGGRLAVQGRQIPELIEHWLRDPYFDGPLPRWHPRGVRPERFLGDAVQMAVQRGWSVRDMLCSATHFVAEAIARAVRKRIPDDAVIDEIIVTGDGQHNGLLLREIGRLTQLPLARLGDLPFPEEALGPARIGLLAMFYLDQVPANPTAITGADVPRLLGRLTPGSPQNWQQLLLSATGAAPAFRPLRSAV